MHDKCDALADFEQVKQGIQKAAMLDEGVGGGAAVGQLGRITHANEIRGNTAPESFQVRNDIAPEVGRGLERMMPSSAPAAKR